MASPAHAVTLERRTPLSRGKPLARGKPLKRTGRLSQKSKRKEEAAADELIEREFVFARDGRRCRAAGWWDPCMGPPTVHHVLKASQGGTYHRDNLVTLCAHHNGLLEADPDFAEMGRARGIVKLRRDVTPPGHTEEHPTQGGSNGDRMPGVAKGP